MNFCTACNRDFGSIKAYDGHRVGSYPQKGPADWLDRIKAGLVDAAEEWKPTPHFGRRCLEDEELLAKGYKQSQAGTWGLIQDLTRLDQLVRARHIRRERHP